MTDSDTKQGWPRVPYVGVGCIVMYESNLLLVQSRNGMWSTPGGHLDFGEDPAECARRETIEETGLTVHDVDFVAITNDVMPDRGRHYLTVWMRGRAESVAIAIGDPGEIADAGWFRPGSLPEPLQPFLVNLIEGRCWPAMGRGAALSSSVRDPT